MDTPGRDPETDLTELERHLGRFRPAPIALDRDRMLFEAGRASALLERRTQLASSMAAVFALFAVGLGGLYAREWASRRQLEVKLASLDTRDRSVPRIAVATVDDPPIDQAGPNSYLVLTRNYLAGTMDSTPIERPGVPPAPAPTGPAPTPDRLRFRAIGELLEL